MRDPKQPPLRNASPDPSARAPDDRRRILASLDRGGGAPAAPVPRLRLRLRLAGAALIALIALAGVLGWAAHRGGAEPQSAPLQPPQPAARRDPAAEPFRQSATANPEPAPAAAIVNETPVQPGPAPLPLPPPSSAKRAARPHAAQPAPDQRAARHRPPAPAPHQAAASAAPDGDVVLLTALVAHASKQAPPQARVADAQADGSNHDVVLPKENETTESLLQRCKQLGFIEGMLCRSRICAGSPESAACAR